MVIRECDDMGKNKYEVIETPKNHGMKITKGDRTIEMSPEMTKEACMQMANLGIGFISEVGGVTVEYFKTQADMYYGDLKAFVQNQTLKSEERKQILNQFQQLTSEYSELIKQTDDDDKRVILIDTYKKLSEVTANLYLGALERDGGSIERPRRPDLLAGIKRLFSKNN